MPGAHVTGSAENRRAQTGHSRERLYGEFQPGPVSLCFGPCAEQIHRGLKHGLKSRVAIQLVTDEVVGLTPKNRVVFYPLVELGGAVLTLGCIDVRSIRA
jgi:hypothetical protein